MHGIARLGAAEMVEAGAADHETRGVGVIQWRQKSAPGCDRTIFRPLIAQPLFNEIGQRAARCVLPPWPDHIPAQSR